MEWPCRGLCDRVLYRPASILQRKVSAACRGVVSGLLCKAIKTEQHVHVAVQDMAAGIQKRHGGILRTSFYPVIGIDGNVNAVCLQFRDHVRLLDVHGFSQARDILADVYVVYLDDSVDATFAFHGVAPPCDNVCFKCVDCTQRAVISVQYFMVIYAKIIARERNE